MLAAILAVVALPVMASPLLMRRWRLSRAKHRSLAGHGRWARRVAGWVPFYDFGEAEFFQADGASQEIA